MLRKLTSTFAQWVVRLAVCSWLSAADVVALDSPQFRDGAYHVYSGGNIQEALDKAAKDPTNKMVIVHTGIYRPSEKAQALIWFNFNHDGITLEASGDVILTAANPALADSDSSSFPAIVNHVVYFGDGISRRTVFRGFKITGGNNFVTDKSRVAIEPRFDALKKTEGYYGSLFFYTDGAGIKIFGRSYPTIDQVEIYENYASPCGGGVSIEHRGYMQQSVLLKNSIFRKNRSLVTGSAVDLLPGSSAEIINCLFDGNISNTGNKYKPVRGNIAWPQIPRLVETTVGYNPEHGSGALTVFPRSRVEVDRCTFIANFNGVDDKGGSSIYRNSIFWMNTAKGGMRSGARYELDVIAGTRIESCAIKGAIHDLRGAIDHQRNLIDCADPQFDSEFRPLNSAFSSLGFRPRRF